MLTTATWADSLTQLKVFYYPMDIQKRRAMYLVNIIAVLLDETALDAAERTEQISQGIKAAMAAGVATIRDGEVWRIRQALSPLLRRISGFLPVVSGLSDKCSNQG